LPWLASCLLVAPACSCLLVCLFPLPPLQVALCFASANQSAARPSPQLI
jgi:hypothetical protein